MKMNRLILCASVLGLTAGALLANPIAQSTQETLREWVKVEQQIATDRNDWLLEKEILSSSLAALREEKSALEEQIAEAEEGATAADQQRAELLEKKDALAAVADKVEARIITFEAQIRELAPKLPEPLQFEITTPLKRMPQPGEDTSTSLSVRLQNVVAILNAIDKFNSIVTKDIAVQDIDGQPTEVTTLYLGLGAAYFTDEAGTYAGYGRPGPDGWTWTNDASMAPAVQELVGVYDQSILATYVPLPVQIVD